ncbi:MAG: acyl-ACP--UDP-N-acetylglucosamine O-acyltransferase [Ignavibacteriales bacterium]|nr:acyl-ACP--UDP-N-acetylglucosamine O-acyltransferase [Ignavibacteriales bacterium]
MVNIHPTAIVSKKARLGENVTVSPFAIIHDDVEIGDDTFIGPRSVIYDYARIGSRVKIYHSASIAHIPQDLKFKGEVTYCFIGDDSTLHEYNTIHRGTAATNKTVIGKKVYLMSYTHIAHDCILEDNVTIANCTHLGGHVQIHHNAVIGGLVKIHQFCRIGKFCMVQGLRKVSKDVPPFILAGGAELSYGGLNKIGLRRNGFTIENVFKIKEIYNYLFNSHLNVTQAKEKIQAEFGDETFTKDILEFLNSSERGIIGN